MKESRLPAFVAPRVPGFAAWRLNLIWVAAFPVAVLTGIAIVRGQLLFAVIPSLLLVGLVLISSLTLAGWCILLLLTTVASRGVVQALHLPSALIFLHYPAVVAFAYVASYRPRPASAKIPATRWLTAFLVIVAISSIMNLTNPLRILLFVVIAGEPLLVIWAIQRWGVDALSERRVVRAFFWLLAIQIPIGLWQGSRFDYQDWVQGTLVGQGAGAHVLAGLFALGVFVWLAEIMAGQRSSWTGPIVVVIGFGMMAVAAAIQVLILGGFALLFVVLVGHRSGEVGSVPQLTGSVRTWLERRRRAARFGIAVVVVPMAILAPFVAQRIIPDLVERVTAIMTLKNFPELTLPVERAGITMNGLHLDPVSSPVRALIGSGPGTTSSRPALLLVPQYEKQGAFGKIGLPLEPTSQALRIVGSRSLANGGSVEATSSEILGIEGDLGVLGFVAFILLLFDVFRAAKASGSWLTPAIGAALVMTFGLCFIDNWLEYPEFSVPLAVLIGLATSPRSHVSQSEGDSRGARHSGGQSLADTSRS